MFFLLCQFLLWQQITKQNKLPKNRPLQPNKRKKQKIKNANDDIKILIDKEAMNSELQQGTNNKCYLKLEENKYIAYIIDAKDDDTRRDLFKKAPAERVNHLYTNNKEIYNYLVKFIQSREESAENTTVTVLPAALKKMKLPPTAQLFINSGS